MACAGVCRLCGYNRDSRLCSCLRRITSNRDPFHFAVYDIVEEIRETRFYGHAKHAEFTARLESIRHDWSERLLQHRCDGFSYNRVCVDIDRAIKLGEGKIFAARLKMSEQPKGKQPRNKREPSERLSNAEIMKRFRATLNVPNGA